MIWLPVEMLHATSPPELMITMNVVCDRPVEMLDATIGGDKKISDHFAPLLICRFESILIVTPIDRK
jgi:hypothetical protein